MNRRLNHMIKKTNELLAGIQYIDSLNLSPMSEPGELARILEAEELEKQAWMVSRERNGTAEEVTMEEFDYLVKQEAELKKSGPNFEDYEDFV